MGDHFCERESHVFPEVIPSDTGGRREPHTLARRAILKGALAIGAASIADTASSKTFDLQHWLDTADPFWVADYHARRLAEAMGMLDATRLYRFHVNADKGFALIVGDPIVDRKAPVARVFLDDGEPLLAADRMQTTVYPSHKARPHGERSRS